MKTPDAEAMKRPASPLPGDYEAIGADEARFLVKKEWLNLIVNLFLWTSGGYFFLEWNFFGAWTVVVGLIINFTLLFRRFSTMAYAFTRARIAAPEKKPLYLIATDKKNPAQIAPDEWRALAPHLEAMRQKPAIPLSFLFSRSFKRS